MSGRPDPRRVEELFDELADLDPDLVARRLDEACGDDHALREAVAVLLAHDRAASRGFLKAPATALAEVLVDPPSDLSVPAADASTGPPRVGRFFLLRKLGEGGMGVVYVGYDEALDRKVAVKLLRRGAVAKEWLLREGQALGRLAHPNVVAVHEIGEHDGRVFLAMELVEGPTLRAWLAAEPRPFRAVIGMLAEAGRGLAAAHAAGLVHRDFKPDNVLVGADGRARVVDFGIASLTEAEAAAMREAPASAPIEGRPSASPSALASPLTQAGAVMGTPAYMAPEQLRGERATAASDQFAFCVALWRAAYGAPPFPTEDLRALARAVAEDTPAPPRRADVPAWLAPILLRGLAKDPAARFPSMDALLAEIGRHLPRHPDLDPAVVRRERRILAGVILATAAVIVANVFIRGPARALATAWDLVRVAAGLLTVSLVAVAVLRQRLAKNAYGRSVAALFITGLVAILLHRLVSARLGTPVPHVLVVDGILLASVNGAASITIHRWLGWLSALSLVGAAVGAWQPALAVPAFATATFSMTAALFVVWSRRA